MDAGETNGSEVLTAEELRATAGVLHLVLAGIDAGRLPADLDHVAYLRGAMDVLSMLSGDCPETKVSGGEQRAETGEAFPHDD